MGKAGKMARKYVYRKNRDLIRAAEEKFFVRSLSRWGPFWAHAGSRMQSMLPHMYKLLTFEPLHNLHLDI